MPGATRDAGAWARLLVEVGAVAAASVLLVAGLVLGGSPAHADTSDDGNLVVDVTDGVKPTTKPTPQPPRPPGPPFTPPGQGGGSGGGVVAPVDDTQATIPDPVAADDALGDDAAASGPITMSGLIATATPSFGVDNGTLRLEFVVRNNYATSIDATARFWVADVTGTTVAETEAVPVDDLEAGETRRVLVTIDGLGQRTVLRAYVRFFPPATMDGDEVAPITRNTLVVIPPLFSISLVSALGLLGGAAWWVLSLRGLRLRLRGLPI
ncbi:hypothetical protein ACFUTX_14060 [Microbacterium sp. NPDC057407]|uniref:hypothetical protein n=1 Tax=Microbacterium sp. NPDC057407 TaxID=3346120 RepID=UPI00366BEB15